MARINLGNFGNVVPQVQQTPIQQNTRGAIANTISNVALNLTQQQMNRQQNEQNVLEQEKNRDDQLLYTNTTAKMNSDIELLDRTIAEDISAGRLNSDNAITYRQENLDNLYKQYHSTVPEKMQNQFSLAYDALAYDSANKLIPVAMKAKKVQDLQAMDQIKEEALKSTDKAKAITIIKMGLEVSGLDLAQQQETIQDSGRRWDKNQSTRKLMEYSEASNIAALQSEYTEESLKKKYPDMTQEDILNAVNSAQNESSRIQKAMEIESKRLNGEAEKALSDLRGDIFAAGSRGLEAQRFDDVGSIVKGTPFEAEFKFYQKQSADFTRFGTMSSQQQLAEINKRKSLLAQNKASDPDTENKILASYQAIYSENINNIQKNPNQVLRNTGVRVFNVAPSDVIANPDLVSKSIFANALSQIAVGDANLRLSPIPQEDVAAAKMVFSKSSSEQKLNLISSLIKTTRGAANGADIWKTTLNQLSGNDPAYVMAAFAKINNFHSTEGEDVATAIINGHQLLKDKGRVRPKRNLLDAEFDAYVGNSATGETAAQTRAAYHAIYEHLTARDNYQSKDTDDVSKKASRIALGLATGGVYDQMKYGGSQWKVSKPYGYDDERFEAVLDQQYSRAAATLKTSVADLKRFRLSRAGYGANGAIKYAMLYDNGRIYNYLVMPAGVNK